eukprot:SAG31_NODE_14317_length_814_cov_1.303497_1_plen_147_part_10
MSLASRITSAAAAIRRAKAIYITAGAGMGVDSGLPDYRGREGLWREYPPLRQHDLSMAEMANPDWFEDDVTFAWGFYGHRLNLYRQTVPHEGFHIMRRWAETRPHGCFVYTSNVDGQVISYFLVFVPTIREIRDFYREMQRTNRESI